MAGVAWDEVLLERGEGPEGSTCTIWSTTKTCATVCSFLVNVPRGNELVQTNA